MSCCCDGPDGSEMGGPGRLAVLASKFGLVGAASAGVYFLCLFALRPLVDRTAVLTAACYVLSAIFNFAAQSRFTFGVTAAASSLLRFAVMHGICLVANSALMHLAVDVLGQRLFLSQVAVSLVVAVLSFAISARWVYRRT